MRNCASGLDNAIQLDGALRVGFDCQQLGLEILKALGDPLLRVGEFREMGFNNSVEGGGNVRDVVVGNLVGNVRAEV